MSVIIRTGRIGERGTDITIMSAKGNARYLSPSWEIVMAHKQGKMSDDEYTVAYTNMVRERYKTYKQPFLDLLKTDELILLCYCSTYYVDPKNRTKKFCHRNIAAEIMLKIAQHHHIEAEIR